MDSTEGEGAEPRRDGTDATLPVVPSGSAGGCGGRRLYHLAMAKTVIVKLTDDLDGGDADETVRFALDGRSYEIDLSSANASDLRAAFQRYIEKGGPAGTGRFPVAPGEWRPRREEPLLPAQRRREGTLSGPGRTWRRHARISDARIKSWVEAGKP